MPRGVEQLTAALRRIFRQQKVQALHLDRERFGDWNAKLADELREAMGSIYLASARRTNATAQDADDFAALAKARAIQTAQAINAATGRMIQEGHELAEVFGDARIQEIAQTEASHATGAGTVTVAGSKKGRVRWKAEPDACDRCRKLDGKVVRAGRVFAVVDGVAIYHPPLHRHCGCAVEAV